jgi:hypothetical protein
VLLQLKLTADQPEAERYLKGFAQARGLPFEEARHRFLAGPAEEIKRQIQAYVAAGVTHFIFTLFTPYDEESLRRFAEAEARRLGNISKRVGRVKFFFSCPLGPPAPISGGISRYGVDGDRQSKSHCGVARLSTLSPFIAGGCAPHISPSVCAHDDCSTSPSAG